MNSNIKVVGKREDDTLILGVGDLDHHEHFDHYEDLDKCDRCGGTDLTFDPKLGNECDTCGYKEWKRLEDQNCGVRSIPGESCPDCGHFMGYVRILGFGHRCKRCGHEDYEIDDQ